MPRPHLQNEEKGLVNFSLVPRPLPLREGKGSGEKQDPWAITSLWYVISRTHVRHDRNQLAISMPTGRPTKRQLITLDHMQLKWLTRYLQLVSFARKLHYQRSEYYFGLYQTRIGRLMRSSASSLTIHSRLNLAGTSTSAKSHALQD